MKKSIQIRTSAGWVELSQDDVEFFIRLFFGFCHKPLRITQVKRLLWFAKQSGISMKFKVVDAVIDINGKLEVLR